MDGLHTNHCFRRGVGRLGHGLMLRAGFVGLLFILTVVGRGLAAGAGDKAEGAMGLARGLEERGDFEAAVGQWEKAAGYYVGRKDFARAAEAYAGWALACRALGFHDLAGNVVRKGLAACPSVAGRARAQLEHAAGAVAAGLRRPGAEGMLNQALALAESAGDARLGAEIFRSLGDLQMAQRGWAQAAGFYAQIRQHPEISRAQALRWAQVKLIGQETYFHPALWSAFLLIGNWL